ncbi:MAG: acyl carrier protein [Bacteroidales bacterium]|jgi:acyl carrier protein|nr:acyl carrier protein [Bacteroidales bacterium]HPC26946.1 acyl carrier protein [Paludibacteraceae bacterium]
MNEIEFVKNFASIFDEIEDNELTMDTEFKDIDEWSSLTALALLAVIDEEYDVKLTNNDLKNSVTVRDIYNIVNNHK